MSATEVKRHRNTLLDTIAAGTFDPHAANASPTHHIKTAVYLGPGAIQVSGRGAINVSGPDAIRITGPIESTGPTHAHAAPQESLVDQAARIRREQQEERERLTFLVNQGTEASAREAARILDVMVEKASETGVEVERLEQEARGCFHLGDLTVGVQWHPSYYAGSEEPGRFIVTLWGAHRPRRPLIYGEEQPELQTIFYQFDVAPQTHEPLWRPVDRDGRPVASSRSHSTRAVAEEAIRMLLNQFEQQRR